MPGLGTDLKLRQRVRRFDPRTLFAGSVQGMWIDPADPATMFQDSAGTVAAGVGDPVGRIADKSGRGNHAVQTVAAARPVLRRDPAGQLYLEFDGVDDCLRAHFAIAQPFDRLSAARIVTYAADRQIFGGASANFGVLVQNGVSPGLAIYDGVLLAGGAPQIGANAVLSERHHGVSSRISVNDAPAVSGETGAYLPGGVTIGSYFEGVLASNIRLYGLVMIGRGLDEPEAALLRRHLGRQAGLSLG